VKGNDIWEDVGVKGISGHVEAMNTLQDLGGRY
jgi:hypothetical protein